MWDASCAKWRRRSVLQAVTCVLAILLCHLVGAPTVSALAPDAITGTPNLGRALVFLPACLTALVSGFMLPFSFVLWRVSTRLARREAYRRRRAWLQRLHESGGVFLQGERRAH